METSELESLEDLNNTIIHSLKELTRSLEGGQVSPQALVQMEEIMEKVGGLKEGANNHFKKYQIPLELLECLEQGQDLTPFVKETFDTVESGQGKVNEIVDSVVDILEDK